ncbi:MAG: HEAT repeat domain-containing protein [Oscillospiraceae bacterium]|nr:HEAT repeat domain-containing protein [Oscillospiraceae bacterium]MDD7279672.1 HEAT repeat domain-containing protein [Oscillospiraceae bacterium]MDY2864241.1 HEAT repeat domain-containing protein [Oscillospiraceae bacterium]
MMFFLKLQFDNIRHENDNYNREELIACTAKIFGETISHRELKKRAKLWYAADHLINAGLLDKLSHSPYIEVRESVAANIHTSTDTLEILLQDKNFEVRETAVLNQNSPLSKVYELLNDDHEDVRKAAKLRLK